MPAQTTIEPDTHTSAEALDDETTLEAGYAELAADPETWGDRMRRRVREDPEFAAAYWEAYALLERCVDTPCHFGNCTNSVDPQTGLITGGIGSPFCGCQLLPGGNSQHLAGTPRPQAPVLPRGRHGSRVQRSTRRHRLPDWARR